jgi:uncharacterized membrane protein
MDHQTDHSPGHSLALVLDQHESLAKNFGSLALHMLFSRLFKVDTDTMMVTSTALICSPPFVPVIAGAIKNREVVVSGLTVGIIGYAVGNYLGFLVAQVLKVL